MTADAELMRLELRNQIAANRAFLDVDPALAERYGLRMAEVAGLACSSCRVWDAPLFNRAIGAGVLGPLDDAGLDAIGEHYDGRPSAIEVYEGITPDPIERLLESRGFAPSGHGLIANVLETDEVPALGPPGPGITVERCTAADFATFAVLTREGFEVPGEVGRFFEDATLSALLALPASQVVAFLARVDGAPAGTGMLIYTERVAGLYSGSVVPTFRGRGIQHQLIVARVREGLRTGRRIFVSQTEGDNASTHNLHDAGFRTLYRAGWWAAAPAA